AVRATRCCTCGENQASAASAIAPAANTPSSFFQPSRLQPLEASTRTKVIHDAREPANSTTTPTSSAATIQPALPRRRPAKYSANGDRLASTTPSLRLHGPSTPPRRSASASCSALHIGRPLMRSEEHTSELQSRENLVCRLL